MGAGEVVAAVLGSSAVSAGIAAWAAMRGKEVDTLHLSEIEFRKALLARVEQLEKGRETDRQRIQELEGEIRLLRIENDTLRRGK